MKELFSIQVVIGIAAIIGGWVGYKIKSYMAIKQELVSKASEKRRETYNNFLSIILGLWRDQKFFDEKTGKETEDMQQLRKKLYDFYTPFLLYAAPATINDYGELMQYLYAGQTDTKKLLQMLGGVIFCMRKEIGLSNKGLQEVELFKGILTDYRQLFG